ncbi:sialin, partial [Biomphalaria pfeifferi]
MPNMSNDVITHQDQEKVRTKLLHKTAESEYHVTCTRKGPPWWRSQRYILAYILCWCQMNIFCQRINLSVAIVCMVNHTAVSVGRHTAFNQTSPFSGLNHSDFISDGTQNLSTQTQLLSSLSGQLSDLDLGHGHGTVADTQETCGSAYSEQTHFQEDGTFVWDKENQGVLLGAIYWSYLTVQIPGNVLVRNVKKKTIILISLTLMTSCTILVHGAALLSQWVVFCLRLIQGGCTALAMIALYGIWSKWAPPGERTGLLTVGLSGQMLGNIMAFPVSALLCKYGFLGGWPSVFYVFGLISLVWLVFFCLFTEDSPEHHKYITPEERSYIMGSLKETEVHNHKTKAPWLSIIKSPPFWGIVSAHVSYTWGLFLFLSTLPQYMFEVLKFDIASNGIFSMLPYIALFVTTLSSGQISDLLIKKQIMRVLLVRKLCIITSNCIPAVALVCLSFLDCHQPELAIVLLVLSVGATGFGLSGFVTNPFDIAPRFAAEIMTISNTLATIPGIITPIVVATVTKNQTREEWQIVLFLTSAIYVLGTAGFCILASADVQPWAALVQDN